MQVLVINRPPNTKREEFFLYAEAFAGLVHMEYISISGEYALQFSDSLQHQQLHIAAYADTQAMCKCRTLQDFASHLVTAVGHDIMFVIPCSSHLM